MEQVIYWLIGDTNIIYYPIVAIIGYLIGSIPFGYLLVKLKKGVDVRTLGSGNIGATNVGRVAGWPWGILCFLLDAAKGFIPTVLLPHSIITIFQDVLGIRFCLSWCGTCSEAHTSYPTELQVAIGLFIILGHLFPVYIQFKGGKGVATALGVFLVIAPYSLLIALCIWIVFLLVLRYVSLASIMAAISLIISPFFIDNKFGMLKWPSRSYIIFACIVVAALVIIKHIPNIKRLIKGTEPKVSFRKKDS